MTDDGTPTEPGARAQVAPGHPAAVDADDPAAPPDGRRRVWSADRGEPARSLDGGSPGGAVTTKPAPAKRQKPRSRWAFVTEFPTLIVISLVLALLIKSFLFQAFYIPSESMVPTLEIGDRVLVNKVVYLFHPPRRGDVIVFADPNPGQQEDRNPLSAFWHWLTEGLGVSTNPEKDFIKRVIALPGDTIEIQRGQVYINGRQITDEPYLSDVKDISDYGPHTVPQDSVFVMGDNRTQSSDSRTLLGDIPLDNVIGQAFVIIWPPSRIGWLRGFDHQFLEQVAAPSG